MVDGRADSEKVGAAAWQSAVYVAALADLIEQAGLDPTVISTAILLIAAKNTSLVPTIVEVDVSRHVRHLRRMLARRDTIPTILDALPEGVTFDTDGMDETAAALHIAGVLDTLGTNYMPSCLRDCPLAFHCRANARAAGDPACLGADARASLGGVRTLGRALQLAAGAPPDTTERDTATQLIEAQRLLSDAALPVTPPAPKRRRRAA